MIIHQIPAGPIATNVYVVACEETLKAAVVDVPPGSAALISRYLEQNNLKLEKIILTHSHWDHIGDAKQLKETYGVPLYIHPLDSPNLEEPGSDFLPMWGTIEGVRPDGFLREGDIVKVGNIEFKVIETPGHTPGAICLYSEKEQVLISGDTLFKGSIGNISFPTSEPEKMWKSLEKLAKLPKETKVYPGHGLSTTIQKENWLPDAKKIFGG